jgi:hypothetical protein
MIFLFTLFAILMGMLSLIVVVLASTMTESLEDSDGIVKGVTLVLCVIALMVIMFIMYYVCKSNFVTRTI